MSMLVQLRVHMGGGTNANERDLVRIGHHEALKSWKKGEVRSMAGRLHYKTNIVSTDIIKRLVECMGQERPILMN